MSRLGERAGEALSLLTLPTLVPQLLWVKRRTPRLPEAAGIRGTAHPDVVDGLRPGLKLLVVGDSMAAGVGVDHHGASLAGQLAEQLAAETRRVVRWRVVARSGATTRSTTRKLAKEPTWTTAAGETPDADPPDADPADTGRPDLVIVVIGINDLLRFRGLTAWRRDLADLVATLRDRLGPGPSIGFSGIPPVSRFPALPQPLRVVLGLRARLMERVLRESAERSGAFSVTLPIAAMVEADEPQAYFATDRFHPSALGYAEVAAAFLPLALVAVRGTPSPAP